MAMAMSMTSSLGTTTRIQIVQPQLAIRKKNSKQRVTTTLAALPELAEASQSAPPDLTWQIWAGAIAGVTPFVVAGIEFSKRIAAQQRCATCGGSGLVKLSGSYFRCGECDRKGSCMRAIQNVEELCEEREDFYRGTRGEGFSRDEKSDV